MRTDYRRTMAVPTTFCALILFLATSAFSGDFMPRNHRELTRTVSYAEMKTFLQSIDGKGPAHLSVAGTTTKGKSIYLVNLRRSDDPQWTILFYAQQHGDEVSGKDALLYLIRDFVEHPETLPPGVDLWILPMMNPDGAEAGTRVNGAGADLNRDHMTLDQPETRALHEVVRRVRPDVAVDCHEFGRESEAYRKRGWMKWPDVTMDALNNPLFHPKLIEAGERWVDEAAKAAAQAEHPFLRYWVGGAPPDDEQRHSAPDLDSGMNAIGAYGTLSFIIEAAARNGDEAIERELGNRVDAYLALLRSLIMTDRHRGDDRAALKAARSRALPPFIPTNYLWVNADATVTYFPVIDQATLETVEIPTANMMTSVAVKRTVPTPLGYAIEPRAATEFATLLERHAIPYERIVEPRAVEAEVCRLVRIENEYDEVYARYEGRQIVKRESAAKRELPEGTLWVSLAGAEAMRAALLLEPAALYGLYQYPKYRALVGQTGVLPVLRVVR